MIKLLPLVFLSVSHRVPRKNQNAVYRLQISALDPEIFKFEKWVKYANMFQDGLNRKGRLVFSCSSENESLERTLGEQDSQINIERHKRLHHSRKKSVNNSNKLSVCFMFIS